MNESKREKKKLLRTNVNNQRAQVLAKHKAVKTERLSRKLPVYPFGLGSPVGKPDWLTQTGTFFPRLTEILGGIEDHGYCPEGWPGLREAFSNQYRQMGINTSVDQFIPTDGARGIIYRAVTALLWPQYAMIQEEDGPTPERPIVIAPDPCYGPFVEAVEEAGGEVIFAPCDSEHNYFEGIKAVLESGVKVSMVFVNFFHNPTGEGCEEQELRWLVEQAIERKFLIFSDRTYSELAFAGLGQPQLSIFNIPGAWEVAYEIFTLSKIFGLARWRIGGGLGRKRFTRMVAAEKGRYGYGLCLAAEVAGYLALTEHSEAIAMQAKEVAERAKLWAQLLPGVKVPPGGFFLWWDVEEIVKRLRLQDSAQFCDYIMLKSGVEMWSGLVFGSAEMARYKVRISLGQPAPMIEQGVKALRESGIDLDFGQPRLFLAG